MSIGDPAIVHRAYAQLRRALPAPAARAIRASLTALLTPAVFSLRTGHWRSSLVERAVTSRGEPLPWYTYPAIDFLAPRRHLAKRVLEFGAGQSTLWWSAQGAHVVALESNAGWLERLRGKVGANVELRRASEDNADACVTDVEAKLAGESPFDVVVIDGLYRAEICPIALRLRAPAGILVADNAEGHALHRTLANSDLQRVDFWGFTPGVWVPHCTSIYFAPGSPWFRARL